MSNVLLVAKKNALVTLSREPKQRTRDPTLKKKDKKETIGTTNAVLIWFHVLRNVGTCFLCKYVLKSLATVYNERALTCYRYSGIVIPVTE